MSTANTSPPAVVLAIDFGTTFTSAALLRDGRAQLLDLDDGPRMPSSVFHTRNGLVAGRIADNQAVLDPASYEPTPKRRVGHGTVLLGEARYRDADLVAAVLGHVTIEARRHLGGGFADDVRLTHPAAWGRTRRNVLIDAAHTAGIEHVHLVPEPVAAAVHYASRTPTTTEITTLAIYDLGGGTFDTAIVAHRPDGYHLIGPPGGIDLLGGIDFDHRLIDHLGTTRFAGSPQWAKLIDPPDTAWHRHRRALLVAARDTKEALSRFTTHTMFIPGLDADVLVTRDEFSALIAADIDATVAHLTTTISAAGLTPQDLTAIYLVGGSSRIPLVADTVWQRTGVRPTTLEDPKAVVALGATLWHPPAVRRSLPPPPPPPEGSTDLATTAGEAIPGSGRRGRTGWWIAAAGIIAAGGLAAIGALALGDGDGEGTAATTPAGGQRTIPTSDAATTPVTSPPTSPTTPATSPPTDPVTTPATSPAATSLATTSPPTDPATTSLATTPVPTDLATMFPGVDFSLCVVLGSTGSGVPMIEGSRCIYPVGEQGAQVIVEFYNWAQDQFPIDVDYWESYASLAGTWSWGQYLQVTANGQQAIYWTYDDYAFSVLAYPDSATGATLADIDNWPESFEGDAL